MTDPLQLLRDDTQRSLLALKKESERLSSLIGALCEERPVVLAAPPESEALTAARRELATLHTSVANLLSENHRVTERYVALELRISRLWNLHAASSRLHEATDHSQLFQIIEEIVAAIVGSEQLAVFERTASGALTLAHSAGIDPEPLRTIAAGEGLIGAAVDSQQVYLADAPGAARAQGREAALTACIPLRFASRSVGAIAIFALLPQKQALGPMDAELFELLSTQAAMALECTRGAR
jgi:hypothetical protein